MLGFYAQHLKEFTAQLFLDRTFDSFLVAEASFVTNYSTEFDGTDLTEGAAEPYISWEQLRPIAFSLIKGRTLPRSFSVVLMLSREKTAELLRASDSPYAPEDVTGLYLNLRYAREQLSVTTGVSFRSFTPDRSLDRIWDKQIERFLAQHELS